MTINLSQTGNKIFKADLLDSTLWAFEDVFGPFNIQVLVEFDPLPDRADFLKGIERTFAQIPILGCRIEKGWWRDRWTPIPDLNLDALIEIVDLPEDSSKPFEQVSEQAFAERVADFVDITRKPPFSLLIFKRGKKGLAIFRFHHSIADGNGCLQVLHQIGENMKSGDQAQPTPVSLERGFFQVLKSFGLKDVPGIAWDILKESVKPIMLLLSKPLAEIAPQTAGPKKTSIKRLVVKGEEYRRLLQAARENGLTINDVLVVALLKIASNLNNRLKVPGKRLNALFTVNLRRYITKPEIQVTNISGLSTISVAADRIDKFKDAARIVHEKTGEMKRKYLGIGWIMVSQLMTIFMPSPLMHFFVKRYSGFVLRQTASHGVGMTNIGAMDEFLAPSGDSAHHASVIATMLEFPLPVITATGFKNRLTLFLGWQYRSEDNSNMCDEIAGQLRYYLEEWPFEE